MTHIHTHAHTNTFKQDSKLMTYTQIHNPKTSPKTAGPKRARSKLAGFSDLHRMGRRGKNRRASPNPNPYQQRLNLLDSLFKDLSGARFRLFQRRLFAIKSELFTAFRAP